MELMQLIDPSGFRPVTPRRHPARRARLASGLLSASGLLGLTVALVVTDGFHNGAASATTPAGGSSVSNPTAGSAGTSSGNTGLIPPSQSFAPPQAAGFAPGGGIQTSSGGS